MFTRGDKPSLVATADRRWELTPPRFEGGASEGSGDSMVGAMCAALARGLEIEDVLRLGAAAGATNFLRHGLGSGDRSVVEELVQQVELRELQAALKRRRGFERRPDVLATQHRRRGLRS